MEILIAGAGACATAGVSYLFYLIRRNDKDKDDRIKSLENRIYLLVDRKEVTEMLGRLEQRIDNLVERNDAQHGNVASRLDKLMLLIAGKK